VQGQTDTKPQNVVRNCKSTLVLYSSKEKHLNSCKNYLNDSTTNKSERVIEEIKFIVNLQRNTEVWVIQLNQIKINKTLPASD
jgi:hypothetical protein